MHPNKFDITCAKITVTIIWQAKNPAIRYNLIHSETYSQGPLNQWALAGISIM